MKFPLHLLAGAFALLLSPALHAATYSVTDLGTLDAPFVRSASLAINAAGVVVGTSRPAGLGTTHAARFSGTGSGNIDLSTSGTFSQATAINAAGQIVGSVSSSGVTQALLFSGTGTGNTDLGTLGGTIGQALGINASGQIVGLASTAGGTVRAVGFSGTGTGNTDFGALGGTTSRANAINDASQVVGSGNLLGDGATHAVQFGPFQGNIDLGTLEGTNSSAKAINANGIIVGEGQIFGDTATHATLFSGLGGGNTDLGTLGGTNSTANAINASGRIVGSSEIVIGDTATHGFLYIGGAMVDLNTLIDPALGWEITDAAGINDAGQIAATGSNGTVGHALLLTPIVPPVAPTVTITGKKSIKTTKPKLTVKGTATGSVTSVTYKLGKVTRTAAGTNAWKFTAKLKPGKNKITVTAHGPGGDSAPAKLTVTQN